VSSRARGNRRPRPTRRDAGGGIGAPSKDGAATLADVASAARVSTATVSRCLNQPDRVAPERRARVAASIEALGYIPHGAAQALASRRSRMIGAVFPRLNSILFGSFFSTLQNKLEAVGYLLVAAGSEYSAASEERQVRQLLSRGVDALVLVGHAHRPGTLELLERTETPHVLCWSWLGRSRSVQIGFSNAEAIGQMARYVVALGHRRIGYISGFTRDNDRAGERLAGMRKALAEDGLALADELVEEIPFDIDEGAAAFGRFMGLQQPPTAVLCGSDVFAFGALREARRRGLMVPRDVTITGFDDTEFASCTDPPLTTVRTPRELMAARVAEALIEHIEHGRRLRSLRLPTELVIRDSSAPPSTSLARSEEAA